jgi:DNA-binding PadR family transcriptional regulator
VTVTESSGTPATAPIPPTGSLSGERAGLRARRAGTTRGTKRSRKVYRITDQGRLLFEQLLDADEPAGTDDARSFGLRLAFARYLAPQARLGLLERRRGQLTRRLAVDRARAAGDRLDVYTRSLVEHSTEATEHDIAWLDRLIEYERQKQAAPRTESRDPRDGDALTATKGTNP